MEEKTLIFLLLMNTKKEMETVILEIIMSFIKLMLYLSPFGVAIIGGLLRSSMQNEFQRMNAQCTEEERNQYAEMNDLKYSVSFSYGAPSDSSLEVVWDVIRTVSPNRRGKKVKLADLVYTCHFSQVSKADLDSFENWLCEEDDSCLEFQTVGGPLVQIKRQMISGMQKSLELIPRGKGVSTERFIAIRGEDGNQIHSFEGGPFKRSLISRNVVGFFLVIFLYALYMQHGLPIIFGVIAFMISSYVNLPYLLNYFINEEE